MEGGSMVNFRERVFAITAEIPRGRVATYGQIAKMLGQPKCARAVGNALHQNRDPIKVPCHRVVNRNGELAVNFGMGGAEIQKKRLSAEGITVTGHKVALEHYQWQPEEFDI